MRIILASQSPRRRALLGLVVEQFEVVPTDVDETLPPEIAPREAVALLAEKKAGAVAQQPTFADCCVIGSDTVVAIDGCILGKPADKTQARQMLQLLSGKTHTVYTGMAVITPTASETQVVETQVTFYPLTPDELERYLETDEPYDKAGGYGIQGKGGLLVQGIRGDYSNVVGLSTPVLYRMLGRLGAL